MKKIPKILVVEDDPLLSKITALKLTAAGMQVIIADDGQKGIEMAQSESPDLILMDLMLPNISGFDALTILKGDDSTKNIPIFVVSVLEHADDVERVKQLGAERFIPKANLPVDKLVEVIKKRLGA